MEPEGSLPHSQEPATCPYLESSLKICRLKLNSDIICDAPFNLPLMNICELLIAGRKNWSLNPS
jgi:hypothetical protein